MPSAFYRTISGPGLFRLSLAVFVVVDHISRLKIGSAAVYLFFVLSGYWICIMWKRKYGEFKNAYIVYFISRFWRILPVFVLCSALTWLLMCVTGTVQQPSPNLFLTVFSSLFILGYNHLKFLPIGPAWSLDIELQFYFIAPLLVSLMTGRPWVLLITCAISLLAVCLNSETTLPAFIAFFSFGIAAGLFQPKISGRIAVVSLGLAALVVLFLITTEFRSMLIIKHDVLDTTGFSRFNIAANVVIALILIPCALFTVHKKGGGRDRMWGDLSFIVYLVHWEIVASLPTAHGSYPSRIFFTGLALAIVACLSLLIWKYFDRPIDAKREQWLNRRPKKAKTIANELFAPDVLETSKIS